MSHVFTPSDGNTQLGPNFRSITFLWWKTVTVMQLVRKRMVNLGTTDTVGSFAPTPVALPAVGLKVVERQFELKIKRFPQTDYSCRYCRAWSYSHGKNTLPEFWYNSPDCFNYRLKLRIFNPLMPLINITFTTTPETYQVIVNPSWILFIYLLLYSHWVPSVYFFSVSSKARSTARQHKALAVFFLLCKLKKHFTHFPHSCRQKRGSQSRQK